MAHSRGELFTDSAIRERDDKGLMKLSGKTYQCEITFKAVVPNLGVATPKGVMKHFSKGRDLTLIYISGKIKRERLITNFQAFGLASP